jgi:sugar/nucleoside kinase (ribokinase family)
VTPDAERTMNTFLGVSSLLCPDDVSTELVAAGQVVYMEGYLYDKPEAKEAYRKAANVAHGAGRKVSLTLSDSFCVDRHRDDFLALVRDDVDLLFANDDELRALYAVDTVAEGVDRVREDCELAAITVGPEGSLVVTRDDVVEVKAEPVERVVDTTGAGDLYAAGFLHGYTQGADLAECGRLGSIAAAQVIGDVGARPFVPLRRLA